MDVMKVKSNLLRKAAGTALNRYLKKKSGYNVEFILNDLEFEHGEDNTNLKLSIEANMTDGQLKSFLSDLGF